MSYQCVGLTDLAHATALAVKRSRIVTSVRGLPATRSHGLGQGLGI